MSYLSVLPFPINRRYVDNNSTPTICSNLLEAKHSLFCSTSLRHALPPARLLCATIGHTPSCYPRSRGSGTPRRILLHGGFLVPCMVNPHRITDHEMIC